MLSLVGGVGAGMGGLKLGYICARAINNFEAYTGPWHKMPNPFGLRYNEHDNDKYPLAFKRYYSAGEENPEYILLGIPCGIICFLACGWFLWNIGCGILQRTGVKPSFFSEFSLSFWGNVLGTFIVAILVSLSFIVFSLFVFWVLW